jgi:hypothetical protein
MISAEFGAHRALNWGEPARALDPYIEFRHYVNDGAAKAEDRGQGFFSLAGALRYFCEDALDVTHKQDMRDRIIDGPPFTAQEREDILGYCEDDVDALARQLCTSSQPSARCRMRYFAPNISGPWPARNDAGCRSIDQCFPGLQRLERHADRSVAEMDRPFGCYEIVKGEAHWRKERFKAYVRATHVRPEQVGAIRNLALHAINSVHSAGHPVTFDPDPANGPEFCDDGDELDPDAQLIHDARIALMLVGAAEDLRLLNEALCPVELPELGISGFLKFDPSKWTPINSGGWLIRDDPWEGMR